MFQLNPALKYRQNIKESNDMFFTRVLILFFSLVFSLPTFSQSITEVRKKQEQTEKEINFLNKLLGDIKNDYSVSLEKLSIINEKIKKGKELISSLTDEINLLEHSIRENKNRQSKLAAEKQKMLDLYAGLVYETWKRRNHRLNKLAFIFSSVDFAQAYARYRYFEQIQDHSKRQINSIAQADDSLRLVNNRLSELLQQQNNTQHRISLQNSQLIVEVNQANNLVGQLKKRQKEIDKKLKIEIENRNRYKLEVQRLMDSEKKKSTNKNNQFKLTPEEQLISDDFVKNKGRLPWPVAEGVVSIPYGENISMYSKEVVEINDGITITTSAGIEVMAVFDGVVEEMGFVSGKNNNIIINHGTFWTLYDNLVEFYVAKGEKVKTRQKIGRLAKGESGNSTINFRVLTFPLGKPVDPLPWLAK
jgi:septal ring factor EnvC (AmiA/AmiB activator)